MFTGIVSAVGQVRAITPIGAAQDMRIEIAAPWPDTQAIAIGASICCAGVCLTVIEREAGWFAVQASAETLSKTLLGSWRVGTPLNLERALRMGNELGGHIVSGHCDGVGTLLSRAPEGGSLRLQFRVPEALSRFIAPKGSIAVDGVSLTVNEVQGAIFGVNIIPHTASATTLGTLAPGAPVNIEIDMLARYVARLADTAVKDLP
jgi:riboflavin synthase